jgi:selenocysteine lyase/cysteine desulfurase
MITRRDSLLALGGAAAMVSATSGANPAAALSGTALLGPSSFRLSGTYLNAAYTHPMPLNTAAAVRAYMERRVTPGHGFQPRPTKALFAKLINATPDEIALVPSTSYAESFVVGALQLKNSAKAHVVTDILHYDGSLYMYDELARRGLGLTVLPMTKDGRIDLNRLESAITLSTRLVAISLVSMVNGFEHDLKAVCDIAHKKGAKVYVDAIQAAGAIPIDVKASNVDFLAASTFKWLMGDFGCGFLYVRSDLLPSLARQDFGYRQMALAEYHVLPGDAPGKSQFEARPNNKDAMGYFEVGTVSIAAEIAAGVSIQNILDTGVENIQRTRQPLVDKLYARLSQRYNPMTPAGSRSPIMVFAMPDAEKNLTDRLKQAVINFQLYPNRFRISPSVYNTMADIDRAIDVLMA